jgi:hypothetical protein
MPSEGRNAFYKFLNSLLRIFPTLLANRRISQKRTQLIVMIV